jgi:glycosyltransferase involved in cell wall biosynthesis
MKITFLTREYPPDTSWGGEAVVYDTLAHELAERGHEVHVICQAVGKPQDQVIDKVFVHKVGTNAKRYSAIARINYNFYAWRKLREVIRKYGIEIVQTSYWSAEGFLYCSRKQTPLVIQSTSSPYDAIKTKNYSGKLGLLKLKILSCLADFTIRRADSIIADSEINYRQVTERLRISPHKVKKILFGVDTQKFKFTPSDIRGKLKIPKGVPLVLFVGRLESRKGIHILSQAIPYILERSPDTYFVLVGRDTNSAPGGGSFRGYIRDKATDSNCVGRLLFIDSLSEEELINLYSACDLFVFPSLQESFGLPVIEAMACGKSVVATHTGVVPELGLERPCGIVVPPGNAETLAQAVVEMLSLKDEEKSLVAKNSRQFVELNFCISTWANRVVKIYEEVLSSTKRRGKQK